MTNQGMQARNSLTHSHPHPPILSHLIPSLPPLFDVLGLVYLFMGLHAGVGGPPVTLLYADMQAKQRMLYYDACMEMEMEL